MSISKYRPQHSDSIRAQSDGEPECVITWVKRPAGGIRMFATRDVRDTGWGQRTLEAAGEVVWHLDANMAHVLIVDRETPAEALRWVLERWAREDAEEAAREIGPGGKRIGKPGDKIRVELPRA